MFAMMCDTNADLLYALLQVEPAEFSREAVRQTYKRGPATANAPSQPGRVQVRWIGQVTISDHRSCRRRRVRH